MTWAVTAERFRCKGKLVNADRARGVSKCRLTVRPGEWFWVNGKKPLCAACAVDGEQHPLLSDEQVEQRRNLLDHRHRRGEAFTDDIIKRAASNQ